MGVSQVARDHLDGGHRGQSQHFPRATMVAAVLQVGSGDNLALDKATQRLPSQRATPLLRTEIERGHAGGFLVLIAVALEAQHQIRAKCVGNARAFLLTWVVLARAGDDGLHTRGNHAALNTGGKIPQNLLLGDVAKQTFNDLALIVTAQGGVNDHAFSS